MSGRDIAIRGVAGALALLLLAWFAHANSGQRVDVDLLLFSIRDISLSYVIYGSVIAGMLLILAVGLRADLRARREIERYRRLAGGDLGDDSQRPARKRPTSPKAEQKA